MPGPAWVHALDVVLFTAPFILLVRTGQPVRTSRPRHNGARPVLRFDAIDQARDALVKHENAAAIVGTLRPDAVAVDIDPTDVGTAGDPVLGDAAAHLLLAWATDTGLDQHVLRESGRPGGRHLILGQIDEQRLAALRDRAAELATHLSVNITVRTSLRLLQSPHRLGLPAPVLSTTISPTSDNVTRLATGPADAGHTVKTGPPRAASVAAAGGAGDQSRSGREFGRAMQCARAGKTAAQAFADVLDCQVVERGGRAEWQRYIWSAVITTLAAERGYTEEQAWTWLQAECPDRADELGPDQWRPKWTRAVAVATDPDRRRRYTPYVPGEETKPDQAEQCDYSARRRARLAEIQRLRARLDQAAEPLLAHRRPQVRQTMGAVIDALVEALVGDGRISVRRLAESARVAGSTAEARRAELLQAGVIRRVATYREDGQVCDLYALGPAVMPQEKKIRDRTCTPPRGRLTGSADPRKLVAKHRSERQAYRPSTLLTTDQTRQLRKAYPDRQAHGACAIVSRARHRQWWDSLDQAEQERRLQYVRARNDKLPYGDLQLWYAWLAERDAVDAAMARLLAGDEQPGDHEAVDTIALTVHHGQRDPLWRVGGTRPSTPRTPLDQGLPGAVRPPAALPVRTASEPLPGLVDATAAPAGTRHVVAPGGTRRLPPPGPPEPVARPAR